MCQDNCGNDPASGGLEVTLQGYWADLAAPAFRTLPADLVVILPLGATEQHGPHLPLGVDRHLVEAVAARMLTHLRPDQNVLLLPALSITKSGEHDGFPGTLSLRAETLLAVLRDIGASLARAGVQRLVLFNGHGGNTAVLDIAARDLRMTHDLIVLQTSWFGFADTAGLGATEDLKDDLHAGVIETSAMLACRSELVDMDKADDFRPATQNWRNEFAQIGLSGQPGRPGWIAEDLHPQGACGNAAAASLSQGEVLLDSAARGFAAFLTQVAAFDHRAGKR